MYINFTIATSHNQQQFMTADISHWATFAKDYKCQKTLLVAQQCEECYKNCVP